MRFRIYMLFPFFILGIISFNIGVSWIKPIHIFIIVFIVCGLLYFFKRNVIWLFVFVFFVGGGGSILLQKDIKNDKYVFIKDKREYEGRVVDTKKDSITIKNTKDGYKITFFQSFNKKKELVEVGDYVILQGRLKEKLSYMGNSMASRGIDGYGKLGRIISIDTKTSILNLPLKIKNSINKGLVSVDKDAGGFVSGLITGYRSNISEDDMEKFNELDIIHIIAVSGFNVAIIYAVIMVVTKKFSMRNRLWLSIIVCSIYVTITGFDPSITRALIMIIMVIIGRIINQKYSTINALSVAGFIMLAINPFFIYNLGFIYSYLATFSIALFNTDIIARIDGYTKLFKDEIGTTISSTLLTFPVLIYSKGYFSLISLIVNIILGPIVGIITILGFITCFVYVIIPFTIVLYPVVFIGEIALALVRIFSNINITILTGQPSVIIIISYYIILLSFLNIIKFKKELHKYILAVGLISIVIISGFYRAGDLKIHFINVGQGDSIFIEFPGGKTMIIDTGDAREGYIAAESKVDPYIKRLGYSHIDYLVASHFHNDHIGGMGFLEDEYPIYNKLSYEGAEDKEFIGVKKGDAFSVSGVEFTVLSPDSYISNDDENKNSLILELKYKDFTALFTGDATKDEMDNIKGDFDLVKIPHHGSKYSVSYDMLKGSDVDSAVITVGTNNFGHPSKECIESLESNNIKIYRTDKDGNIVFTIKPWDYKVNFNN
ncbi:MAG: DNA internalization-related competence protein ComEC/Rec2 [Clostridium sp.]